MDSTSYLLFTLADTTYGIEAVVVQEIVLLPALIGVPEAAPDLAGVVNVRGQLLSVIDLGVSLGHGVRPPSVNQPVVLIRAGDRPLGLMVDQIITVTAIAAEAITTSPDLGGLGQGDGSPLAGLAKLGDEVVVLLNPARLGVASAAGAAIPTPPLGDANRFMAQFDPADRQVLGDRAAALAQTQTTEDASDLEALAVVSLDGEHFALGLEGVHEFTDIAQVTPIPCCPPHIVGNMNLRGEILTLVDVRRFLSLTSAGATQPRQAVVLRLGDLVAGVVVDEVFDVVYVKASSLEGLSTTLHSRDNPYLRGVTRWEDTVLGLVDLPKLLTRGELVVDQAA